MLADVERPPLHPVHLVGDAHDLRRSRVTVFFRLPLAIPHIVWLVLWTIAAIVVAIVNWFVTLFAGTPPRRCTAFLSRYVRYCCTCSAFVYLAANPFPGFDGRGGRATRSTSCCPAPARQNRWKTGFRIFLAIPAIDRQQRARLGAPRRRDPHVVRRARHAARRRGGCATSRRTRFATARS